MSVVRAMPRPARQSTSWTSAADAQLGLAQMAEIALVIAVLGLALDHQGEAVVEAELVDVGDVALLLQGLGHAAEAEL